MATVADVVPGSAVRNGFHDPSYLAATGSVHLGADLAAPVGTPVEAPVGGTVSFAGWDNASGDGGNGVKIAADDGASIGVWHLSRIDVATGQRVATGQQLGLSGQSGGAVYPHTHLQVEVPPGNPIDPLPYLAGLGRFGVALPILVGTDPLVLGGLALLALALILDD